MWAGVFKCPHYIYHHGLHTTYFVWATSVAFYTLSALSLHNCQTVLYASKYRLSFSPLFSHSNSAKNFIASEWIFENLLSSKIPKWCWKCQTQTHCRQLNALSLGRQPFTQYIFYICVHNTAYTTFMRLPLALKSSSSLYRTHVLFRPTIPPPSPPLILQAWNNTIQHI